MIKTYVTKPNGQRKCVEMTCPQFIFSKLSDFQWHTVSEFTSRMSRDGMRGRISTLSNNGWEFAKRYDKHGRLTHVRLVAVPGIHATFVKTP